VVLTFLVVDEAAFLAGAFLAAAGSFFVAGDFLAAGFCGQPVLGGQT